MLVITQHAEQEVLAERVRTIALSDICVTGEQRGSKQFFGEPDLVFYFGNFFFALSPSQASEALELKRIFGSESCWHIVTPLRHKL
jgi:hypothetical protein